MRDRFQAGLAAYREGRYPEARTLFQQALECVPDEDDRCSETFIRRLDRLEESPMPPDWDGVWQYAVK